MKFNLDRNKRFGVAIVMMLGAASSYSQPDLSSTLLFTACIAGTVTIFRSEWWSPIAYFEFLISDLFNRVFVPAIFFFTYLVVILPAKLLCRLTNSSLLIYKNDSNAKSYWVSQSSGSGFDPRRQH